MLAFSSLVNALFHRLYPYCLDVPTAIVDDSGKLRSPTNVFMGRKPIKRSD